MIETPVSASDRSNQVIHANWSGGYLHLWCEQSPSDAPVQQGVESDLPVHPFAVRPADLPSWVQGEQVQMSLRLPAIDGEPIPSAPMSRVIGRDDDEDYGVMYGYNSADYAEINNKMSDDIKVVLAEYRLALKKYKADRQI